MRNAWIGILIFIIGVGTVICAVALPDGGLIALLFLGAAIFYFVPLIIAYANRSNRISGIFWLNLLIGWTVLGWVIALIWAILSNENNKRTIVLRKDDAI